MSKMFVDRARITIESEKAVTEPLPSEESRTFPKEDPTAETAEEAET